MYREENILRAQPYFTRGLSGGNKCVKCSFNSADILVPKPRQSTFFFQASILAPSLPEYGV